MRWVVRALAILFAAVVGRGASVFGFSFVCGTTPDCAAGPGVEASFLALGSAFILSQIGGGLLFLYGFAKLRAVRLEFGADHARNVERARVFLSLTVVLLLAGFFAPFLLIPTSPPGIPAREPIFSVLAGPILSSVAALFAGMILLSILHQVSTRRDRLGLGTALMLVVAGGLFDTSYATRLIPAASLVIRIEMRSRTSCGILEYTAVIPSIESTARMATVWPYTRTSPCTPTVCTGRSTAKYCHGRVMRLRPAAARISSSTMADAPRTRSTRSGVTSPMTRTASPGPGNGCRSETVTPSARATARPSSL